MEKSPKHWISAIRIPEKRTFFLEVFFARAVQAGTALQTSSMDRVVDCAIECREGATGAMGRTWWRDGEDVVDCAIEGGTVPQAQWGGRGGSCD